MYRKPAFNGLSHKKTVFISCKLTASFHNFVQIVINYYYATCLINYGIKQKNPKQTLLCFTVPAITLKNIADIKL